MKLPNFISTLLLIAAVFVCLMFGCGLVKAATYYVKPAGSDASAGTSWGTAWATIGKVNSSIAGGDTVFFYGTNRGQIIPVSGTGESGRTYYVCGNGVDDTWLTDRSASIWGSDSISGWTVHSGSVYKAAWTPTGCYEDHCETFGQNSTGVDTVFQPVASAAAVNAAGKFYYDPAIDTIYAWAVGGGDPDTYGIEASCKPVVFFNNGADYTTFYGLDIRYGQQGVVFFFSLHCDFNRFEHCNITRSGHTVGENVSAIFSAAGQAEDSIYNSGWGNQVVACTLGYAVDSDWLNSTHAYAVGLYQQWRFIIDSCVVIGWPNTIGLEIKSRTKYCVVRNTKIIMNASGYYAIEVQAGYDTDSIYGNVFDMNGAELAILLKGWRWNSGANPSGIYIANNTFSDCEIRALVMGIDVDPTFYHDPPNVFKYNIIHTISDPYFYSDQGGLLNLFQSDSANWTVDSNWYVMTPGVDTALFRTQAGPHDSTKWVRDAGLDSNSTWYIDPGFADTANGDFSRPSASNEMNQTYGGKTWTIYGAVQPATATTITGTIGPTINNAGASTFKIGSQ